MIQRRIENQENAIKENKLQQKEKGKKFAQLEAEIIGLEKKIKDSEREIQNLSPPDPKKPQYTSLFKKYEDERDQKRDAKHDHEATLT